VLFGQVFFERVALMPVDCCSMDCQDELSCCVARSFDAFDSAVSDLNAPYFVEWLSAEWPCVDCCLMDGRLMIVDWSGDIDCYLPQNGFG
jgi:hypothetical protein